MNISNYRCQGYYLADMKGLDKDVRVKILHIISKAFCIVYGYQQLEFVVGRNCGNAMSYLGVIQVIYVIFSSLLNG